MRRREDYAIRPHTINLYDGDYERLQTIHGTRIGAAKIIRDLVRDHLREVERKALRRITESEDALDGGDDYADRAEWKARR